MSADVGFEPRSLYWACRRCGSLVTADDRERHRRWHRSTTPAAGPDRTDQKDDR